MNEQATTRKPDLPPLIGHRGASYLAPENTVRSVKLAFELGADEVEIDIRKTADGRIVAMHDANTRRVSGTDLAVAAASAAELRVLDVGSWKGERYRGERIPFLAEVLALVDARRRLVIEIKAGPGIVGQLAETLVRTGTSSHCSVLGFDAAHVHEAKSLMPDVPCYQLWAPAERDRPALPPETERLLIDRAREAGLAGLSLAHQSVTRELVGRVHEAGLRILTWTVDEPDRARQLAGWGIDAITTNRPGWLRARLAGAGT